MRKNYARTIYRRKGTNKETLFWNGQAISVRAISIPDGENLEELWQILHLILEEVPEACRVTLDVTHSFRVLPFLYFTAALYLRTLRSVQIEAVYYSMYDSSTEDKPIVDLSIILDMVEWFYATRNF